MAEQKVIYENSKVGQILTVILLVFAFATHARATSLIPINTDTVKRSVIFLFATDKVHEVGTGFLVEIPSLADPTKSYIVLITARHMVDPIWAHAGAANPAMLYARLNKKTFDPQHNESGVDFVEIPLVINGNPTWHRSDKDTIDVAVVPIDSHKFLESDIATIKIYEFGTPDELKAVGIGDEIISAGLVPHLSGQKRNYPFFKFGRVSNIPEEDTLVPCADGSTRPVTLWYVAATLVGGNSGSPIIALPPGNVVMHFGNSRPFLLGLQSMSLAGGEIAGMTPAQYIFEVLDSLHLKDANAKRIKLK
jgi:hypothetical protein